MDGPASTLLVEVWVVTGRIASLVSYRRLPSLRLVWVRGPSMVPTL